MVDQTRGDGIVRPIHYASWRNDKPASTGYSQELINKDLPKACWD